MSNQYLDADFLKEFVQHTEDEITVSAFGDRVIKIKKLTSLESRAMGNMILSKFGKDKFEKYILKIEQIKNESESNFEIEAKMKELMGKDYDKFTQATMDALAYKVSKSTKMPLDLIKKLDESILVELSDKIEKAFSKGQEDIKKKL